MSNKSCTLPKKMRRLFIFSILIIPNLCLFSQLKTEKLKITHGTCILTCITRDSIWIASDSKEGEIIGNKQLNSKFSAACKIHNYNNFYYCVSGMHRVEGNTSGTVFLDAEEEVLKVLKLNKSFFENFTECNKVIVPKLTVIGKKMDKKLLEQNPNVLQISISAFSRDHRPMHINWGYNVTRNGNELKIEPKIVSLINLQNQNILPVLSPQGITDEIVSYLGSHKTFFQVTQEMKNMLTTLIKIQISKNSNVGPPILVKVIYANGDKWETNHEACK